jgi:hypothetical protein
VTAVEVLALGLGCALIVAIILHAAAVTKASRKVIETINNKPVSSSVHTDIAHHAQRIAIASEKVVNERSTQVESQRVQDMNEVLVQGVIGVLDFIPLHPEGLKDDVIVGREQATEEFKERLKAALDAALKTTHQ